MLAWQHAVQLLLLLLGLPGQVALQVHQLQSPCSKQGGCNIAKNDYICCS